MSNTDEVQPERLLGQVKWFNNKAGYGFITVNDGEHSGKEIFIHYTTIRTSNKDQYKYLVQGEYVEFNLVKSTTEKHEYQAVDISGIKGGPLMCETRRSTRSAGPASSVETRPPRSTETAITRRRYKVRDEPVRSENTRPQGEDGYEVVRKRRAGPRANKDGPKGRSKAAPKEGSAHEHAPVSASQVAAE
jgi:cold shock CspA family protein